MFAEIVLSLMDDLAKVDAVAQEVAPGGQRVTATEAAEILLWEMHATLAA